MITNKQALPDVIVRAVSNDTYSRGKSDITVTQLIDSPRAVALRKNHGHEIVEDASDRIWSLLGQAVHSVLERAADESDLVEQRIYQDVLKWKLGGQFDLFSDNVLYDFKVTSVWKIVNLKNGCDPQWEAQLNVLAWLLRENGTEPQRLAIIAILRDWSKHKSRDHGYPSDQVVEVQVPLWTHDQQTEYIYNRIVMHQDAQDNTKEMPLCTPEERWAKPDVFAVMKEGRKSAIKLYHNFDDASARSLEEGDKFFVEHRKGGSVRCESYCSAAPFCSQYMDELKNG